MTVMPSSRLIRNSASITTNAGADLTITSIIKDGSTTAAALIKNGTGTLILQGEITDDALPADLGVNFRWSLLRAPVVATVPLTYATATFADSASLASEVTFSHSGIYTLQLEAEDGAICSRSLIDVRVAINAAAEIPSGLVAWWPGNHDNREVIRSRDETGVNVALRRPAARIVKILSSMGLAPRIHQGIAWAAVKAQQI